MSDDGRQSRAARACLRLGDKRTKRGHRISVEIDPQRHFTAVNSRIAKGLSDRLVGSGLKARQERQTRQKAPTRLRQDHLHTALRSAERRRPSRLF
jgi:hypothetical protein